MPIRSRSWTHCTAASITPLHCFLAVGDAGTFWRVAGDTPAGDTHTVGHGFCPSEIQAEAQAHEVCQRTDFVTEAVRRSLAEFDHQPRTKAVRTRIRQRLDALAALLDELDPGE